MFFFIKNKSSFISEELLLNVVWPTFSFLLLRRRQGKKNSGKTKEYAKGIFWFSLIMHLPPYSFIPGLKYYFFKKD